MTRSFMYACMGVAVAAMTSGTTLAATDGSANDLEQWDYSSLEGDWLASRVLDADVHGTDGRELGEVHNLILDGQGKLKSVIVEAGGFLDVGDNHFRVPWSEVKVAADGNSVTVPVSADNIDAYTVFDGERLDKSLVEDAYRASELVRTFVSLEDRKGYGMVTDLVFSPEGELEAVVAQPAAGYGATGAYAVPYAPGMYHRPSGTWEFPYSDKDLEVLRWFGPANLY